MLDRRPDRARRNGCGFLRPAIQVELVELPNLPVGSPAQVAVAGVAQIQLRDLLETALGVESGGNLVGERLVVNKAIGAGGADGQLIESLGIELALFDARDFGAHQGCAGLEIRRAVLRPDFELPMVLGERRYVLLPLFRLIGSAGSSARQRAVEVIFRRFHREPHHRKQASRLRLGIHGRCIVAREKARLQLASPIGELGARQIRLAG